MNGLTEHTRDRTYAGDGTPFVLLGLAALALAFLVGLGGVVLARAAGSYLLGVLSVIFALAVGSVAVVHILRTPTQLHLRRDEVGFTFLDGETLWVPRSSVAVRIATIGSAGEGLRVLRFDTPYAKSVVPLAYDPTTLVGDDGSLLDPQNLEQGLGMRVRNAADDVG